ncbi:MAG: endonuclease/exonuclease/phosphatase family protein [Clostridia bacterium]|nr:endonuclease/exonuclease/phosphatase family protein [Clostridia bacterium]
MPTIISWNTQGNCLTKLSEAHEMLFSPARDNIIMIQEAGNIQLENINFGRQREPNYHNFNSRFFEQQDALNIRCTTGMLVEDSYVNRSEIFQYAFLRRPIVCCEFLNGNEKYVFATVHLTANAQAAAQELIDINLAFRNQYDRGVKWIVIGDFNCQPNEINSNIPINISHPHRATHRSGRILDYAIYSDSLRGRIQVNFGGASGYPSVPLCSDHYPIYCRF